VGLLFQEKEVQGTIQRSRMRPVFRPVCVVVALASTTTGLALENSCNPGETCIPFGDCRRYQNKHAIIFERPRSCGSSGGESEFYCCPPPETRPPVNATPATPSPDTPPPPETPNSCGLPDFCKYDFEAGRYFCFAAVLNGMDAVNGKWLWIALFGRRAADGSLGDWFCGGTLISARYVLTAAHCLRPGQEGSVDVRLGDLRLSNPTDTDHQDRGVAEIIRHPDYRGKQNDIALVRLDRPAELNTAVRPLCLPQQDQLVATETFVEMAGWGRVGFDGQQPDVLQQVSLVVTDPETCEQAFRNAPQFEQNFPGGFNNSKVCAGSRDAVARDACPGDSGGPLMWSRGQTSYRLSIYELVGVVSTGIGCGNPDFPGIYTRVSSYVDWINSNMQ